MISDLRQESFTHARCFKCQHVAAIEKFGPELVPIEQCKTMDITITEKSDDMQPLMTIQCKCPMCSSFYVELLFASEMN